MSQRKQIEVSNVGTESYDYFGVLKAQAPFRVLAQAPALFELAITLDSLLAPFGGAFGSEGISALLLDVTDPLNPSVMTRVDGFYFGDSNGVSSSFTMGANDLSSNFQLVPPISPADPQQAHFMYSMPVELDPSNVYAINVQSDIGAGNFGGGSVMLNINSMNTLNVSLTSLDPNARLHLPGAAVAIPEPSAGLMLFVVCAFVGGARYLVRRPERRWWHARAALRQALKAIPNSSTLLQPTGSGPAIAPLRRP